MKKLSLLVLAFLLSCSTNESVRYNQLGIKALKEENHEKAFKLFLKALGEDPFNPYIRYNLAHSLFQKGEVQKAIDEFKKLEEELFHQGEKKLRFHTLFNQAYLESQQGNIEEALEAYQKTLEINPSSKEVKRNIELLFKENQSSSKNKNNQEQKKDQDSKEDEQKKDKNGQKKQDKEKSQEGKKGDKSKKNDQNEGEKDGKKQDQPEKSEKKKAKKLSEAYVKRILDELKNEEQKIRAKKYQKGQKRTSPDGKNW